MEYKATYTHQEVEELKHWFETHEFEQTLDMGHGLYIEDLGKTIPPMLHIAMTKYENRVFSGQIYTLFRIKEELIAQGKVKGERPA